MPTVLRQDGWEIVYGYRDDGARPSRLVLAYPGIEVRLALDSYVESGPAVATIERTRRP